MGGESGQRDFTHLSDHIPGAGRDHTSDDAEGGVVGRCDDDEEEEEDGGSGWRYVLRGGDHGEDGGTHGVVVL